jgi:predicted methyltransferase
MAWRSILFASALAAAGSVFVRDVFAADASPALRAAVESPQRPEAMRSRDVYRHPKETLAFFGIEPTATVVEIWPGGGYWTDILASYLHDQGHYIVAVGGREEGFKKFKARLDGNQALYGMVTAVSLDPPKNVAIAPAGTVDAVLTFRNVHNWMKAGTEDAMFAAFFRALKPGGVLGLEEHRAPATKPQDPKAANGYVREDYVIALAKKAGFSVVAKADINANAKDTKDYADGVWTLPPTLKLGDKDRARYEAIGESDRMTLLFRKPAAKKG